MGIPIFEIDRALQSIFFMANCHILPEFVRIINNCLPAQVQYSLDTKIVIPIHIVITQICYPCEEKFFDHFIIPLYIISNVNFLMHEVALDAPFAMTLNEKLAKCGVPWELVFHFSCLMLYL